MCLSRSGHSRGAGVRRKRHEGGGNAALWKARKAKNRLPALPPALGNRMRDSHISTAATTIPYTETQQVALRATVTHVAGLKCYPCPRRVMSINRAGVARFRHSRAFSIL